MFARSLAPYGALLLVTLGPATGRAEGFLSRPPTVGTSVTYRLQQTIYSDDDEEERDQSMTVRCVGKEETDDGDAYWIEVERPGIEDSNVWLFKFQIKEKHCSANDNPLSHLVRGYVKRDIEDEDFEELDLEGDEMQFYQLLIRPVPFYEQLTGAETKELQIADVGRVTCAVRKGEMERDIILEGEATVFSSSTLCLSADVPFGIAQAETSTDLDFGEGGAQFASDLSFGISIDTELAVSKVVLEGAVSALPDAK